MTEIGLLVLGVVLHWTKKLAETHQTTGTMPNVADAFLEQPYKVVWTSLIAVGGGVALHQMGELTPVTALVYGFSADSVAGMLKRRAQ